MYTKKKKQNITEREKIILEKLAEGFTEKEICQVEGFSTGTFSRSLELIKAKLGAVNRANLIYEAVKQGFLNPNN